MAQGKGNGPSSREQEVAALLADLAQGLHGVAMPADVVEEEIRAVGQRQGVPVHSLLLQSALELQVGDGAHKDLTLREMDFETHWNLRRLGDLQRLARSL